MNRLFHPLLVITCLGVLASGCGKKSTEPTPDPEPWTEVELLNTTVTEADVALQVRLLQVQSPWFDGVVATGKATNLRSSAILFWDSCAGGVNPAVSLRDQAGAEYDDSCYPRPLCPESMDPYPLDPQGSSVSVMHIAGSACQGRTWVPLDTGRYTVAVRFRYQEKAGGPYEVITQTVPFDWDAETLTGSVPD